jgi:hypothetical protein
MRQSVSIMNVVQRTVSGEGDNLIQPALNAAELTYAGISRIIAFTSLISKKDSRMMGAYVPVFP